MTDKTTSADRHSKLTIRGRDVRIRTIGIAVLGILAVWFVAVNTDSVEIQLWVATVTLPLWAVLAVTLIVGAAIGWLLARRRAAR
ncbi:LapA family protein [Kitasatospora sp. A2-31]|uniref:LapA family protein n=1 Tax=Kitasatospora sp. A2-31 TaxID=2916414 RepID=UPI001EEE7082|nr:LapA family protein [Kitasatospora sp. A2-31]MCG6499779.1 LapA family protein [Kitasatospora sp. A2-31]